MKSIARLHDGGARTRLGEYVSAGQVHPRRGTNLQDENSRLKALVASLTQKLATESARHADTRVDAKRAQNVIQSLTAENALLRARVDALRPEVRFNEEATATKSAPPLSATATAATASAVEVANRLASDAAADPNTRLGAASRELHGWTLEGVLAGTPVVAHVAHAILRPLRRALEAEGAMANAHVERAYVMEVASRGGVDAIRELLHSSPLVATLASDIHHHLLAGAASPTETPLTRRMAPLARKFVHDPPGTEAVVHVRLRLAGRVADFNSAARTRLTHALAALTHVEPAFIHAKLPMADAASHGFAVDLILLVDTDSAASSAAGALTVAEPPRHGTREFAALQEAAHRTRTPPEALLALATEQRQAELALLAERLGVPLALLGPPLISTSKSAPMSALGGVHNFYGGLPSLIGRAHPSITAAGADAVLDARAMELLRAEHCERRDSRSLFTSRAHGVTTTSELEFWFVVDPIGMHPRLVADDEYAEIMSSPTGWPAEPPFLIDHAAAPARTPTPLAAFSEARAAHDGALAAVLHPHELELAPAAATLSDTELVALRLYTGPLADKYQAVLRAAPGRATNALDELRRLCGPADGGPPPYANTLHAINAGVLKLGRLSGAAPLYVAHMGMHLPPEWYEKDALSGTRGGVEFAFFAGSADKAAVLAHATRHEETCVLEIQQGLVDRGAEIAWLSQYPHEREVLLPSMCALEVATAADGEAPTRRIEGGVVILGLRAAVARVATGRDDSLASAHASSAHMSPVLMAPPPTHRPPPTFPAYGDAFPAAPAEVRPPIPARPSAPPSAPPRQGSLSHPLAAASTANGHKPRAIKGRGAASSLRGAGIPAAAEAVPLPDDATRALLEDLEATKRMVAMERSGNDDWDADSGMWYSGAHAQYEAQFAMRAE